MECARINGIAGTQISPHITGTLERWFPQGDLINYRGSGLSVEVCVYFQGNNIKPQHFCGPKRRHACMLEFPCEKRHIIKKTGYSTTLPMRKYRGRGCCGCDSKQHSHGCWSCAHLENSGHLPSFNPGVDLVELSH